MALFGNTGVRDQWVFKFPFTNPLFLSDEQLLAWPYSSTILVTAYDLLKSDMLVTKLQRTGMSLREYFHDLGFNKDIKILADTGIFAFEFRKKMNRQMDQQARLDTSEIFHAYDLIDPDFLISPDEMILMDDDEAVIRQKIQTIKHNLDLTIDRFEKKRIIATIQGVEREQITELCEHIEEVGITNVARGGLLPLIRYRVAFRRVLRESEVIARQHGVKHLHAFGLPGIPSMVDIFVNNSYDSVDTSNNYFYTAENKYITMGGRLISVTRAFFNECGCIHCRAMLRLRRYPNSTRFVIELFGHNSQMFVDLHETINHDPEHFKRNRPKYYSRRVISREMLDYTSIFTTANNLDDNSRRRVDQSQIHMARLQYINRLRDSRENILVISGCSASKKITVEGQPEFSQLKHSWDREKMIEKYADLLLPATDMYTGYQHSSIKQAVRILRQRLGKQRVDHLIVSAGFGLIRDSTLIPPYDSTFSGHTISEIKSRARRLGIVQGLGSIGKKYQLVFVALGSDYLTAIGGIDQLSTLGNEVVIFDYQDTPHYPVICYSGDEFREMEEEGVRFSPDLSFPLKLRGNLLINFARQLGKTSSFTKFWHQLLKCSCEVKL